MLRPKTRWKRPVVDHELAGRLAKELNVHPVVAELLFIRGISDPEQAERFLRPHPDHFLDPHLLLGMEPAVDRILHAVKRNEKIRIYGDYDADGVSSTVTMIHTLRALGARFDWAIPHRIEEGYGLHLHSVEKAREDGVGLIVTVDNGISAVEPIALARELGMDVIVTDHHEPPEQLPEAFAIINPKQPGCPYPFKQLAGVGVAFKLAHALWGRVPEELAEFAAIGTIADVMPLVEENRLLVTMGLERMRKRPSPGVRALLKAARVDEKGVAAGHIAFAVGPRINAGGRLDSADEAVRLLLATDEEEAAPLAARLDQLNRERQELVETIFDQALEQAMRREGDEVIVAAGMDWNVGVVGIVASRLLERFYRPAVVLSVDGESGLAKGSARSIPGFDLHEALTACADLLEQFGGHAAAAGMTLKSDRIGELRERLCALARSSLKPEDYIPVTEADIQCGVEEISLGLLEQLAALEPYGVGNPTPRFLLPELEIVDLRWLGKDGQHLKLSVAPGGSGRANAAEAIAFQCGHWKPGISATSPVDIVGEIGINEWNGRRKPQIIIRDLRIPVPQVHDWRGRGPEPMHWDQVWPASLETGLLLCGGIGPAVEASNAFPASWGLWSATADGSLEPLNDAARKTPWRRLSGIVLYTLPPDVAVLKRALEQTGEAVEHIAAWFADVPRNNNGGSALGRLPARDDFKKLYACLRQAGRIDEEDPGMWAALARATGQDRDTLRWMLEVFDELGFLDRTDRAVALANDPPKRDLGQSRAYREKMAAQEAERLLIRSGAKELAEYLRGMLPPRARLA